MTTNHTDPHAKIRAESRLAFLRGREATCEPADLARLLADFDRLRAEVDALTPKAEAARAEGFWLGFNWVEEMVDDQRRSDRTDWGWDALSQWLEVERQRTTIPDAKESPGRPQGDDR